MADLIPLATVVLLLWRLEPLAKRLLVVLEKRLEARNATGIPDRAPMPTDLYSLAMGETESWARDQALDHINELHDTLGDWSKVRTALMTGSVADGN